MSALRPALAAILASSLLALPLAAQETAPAAAPADGARTEAPAGAGNAEAGAAGTEAAPAAGTDFSQGEEVTEGSQLGQDYVVATQGAWEVRCVHTADGFDPCRIYQLLKDEQGNSVAEFSMVALDEAGAAAGATIVTPLETLLTAQLTLAVDSGTARRYPFSWCAPVGCIARVGLTAEELAALKRGARATVTIVPMVAPDRPVNLGVSLTGFTAAYQDMSDRNAATQRRAEEAQKAAGAGGGEAGAN